MSRIPIPISADCATNGRTEGVSESVGSIRGPGAAASAGRDRQQRPDLPPGRDPSRRETAALLVDAVATGQLRGRARERWTCRGPRRTGSGGRRRRAFEQAADDHPSIGFQHRADGRQSQRGCGLDPRAVRRPGLPDAAHIACARAAGATALITNDRRIRARLGLEVLSISTISRSSSRCPDLPGAAALPRPPASAALPTRPPARAVRPGAIGHRGGPAWSAIRC